MSGLLGLVGFLLVCWVIVGPIFAAVSISSLGRRLRELEARLVAGEYANQRLADEIRALKTTGPRPAETTEVPPAAPAPIAPAAPVETESPTEATPGEPAREDATAATAAPDGTGSVPPVWRPAVHETAEPAAQPVATSLEERLGTRWAVWIGGIALALGGLLLARYTIEQGYFGPGVRVIMGLIFATALIAAGEWFRRGERPQLITVVPSAHIPGVLTAAGTVTAFGTIYAAHALYGFIGPAAAFVLLGCIGIATMLAAGLHGPALAGLGLAGSFVAPMLVATERPNPWPVVIYLGVVAASAMGLARMRRWLWLAALAVGGAILWGLPFIDRMSMLSVVPNIDQLDWTLASYLHGLVQLALAAGFIAVWPSLGTPEERADPDPIAFRALAALTLLIVMMLGAARFDVSVSVPFTLAAIAILLVTAWTSPPSSRAAVLAGVVALAGIGNWPGLALPPPGSLLSPVVTGVLRLPENISSFLGFAALTSLAVTASAWLRLARGRILPPATAGYYALAATTTPLLALVLAYLRVKQFDTSIHFGLAGLALAALFAYGAGQLQRLEIAELPGTRLGTGAFAAAAIAGLCFALVTTLDRGYLTVALALTALGTAYIAVLKDIPLLRHVVAVLAAVVLGRIIWDPRIMGEDVGRMPVLNWLLIGYGVPAAAFWQSARILEAKGQTTASRLSDAAAVLLSGLLIFFQVHHALNGGDPLAPRSGHVEQGLLAAIALGFSHALMRLDLGRANPVFHYGSMAYAAIGAALIVVGLGLHHNPLFSGDRVLGPVVFSSLVLAYLLPGLTAAVVSRNARAHRPTWYITALAIFALLLVFGYVTLEVRHVFQGPSISLLRRTSSPEQWAYSAAWLALGILFLAYGIVRASLEARIASAALVLLSVGKVFLFDLAGLTGLWRALSLIVLGLVLIGIGLVYQNYVFARPKGRK